MTTNRRDMLGWMGAGGAAVIAGAGQAAVPPRPANLVIRQRSSVSGRDYRAALAKLRDYATAELDAVGQKGMTLAIADGDGFAATLSVGWADAEARIPVRPDHRFEIGSISKSITGLCLHSLADEGKIDLGAPISRYVDAPSLPEVPMTLAQLLNHAGGLPHDAPLFPDAPHGRLWSGFEPGSRFSYSNIGYALLGHAIQRVTGRPHPEVIAERVLRPLGMTDAAAHLMAADRARFATGYVPFIEDRPILLRPRMIPGPFDESDHASGAVGATSEAMLAYVRFVIGLGRGRGGPLFSDARAKALLAADLENDEFGPHSRYASGFATVQIDGRPALHHTGGMILFTSSFHVDPKAGVGCFASVNGRIGPYRPRKTTAYAVQLMRAVREGRPLPDAPDPRAYRKVGEPRPWLGRWYGPEGAALELLPDPMGLKLAANGSVGRVETGGAKSIVTDHPAYSPYGLQLDAEAPVGTSLWWGARRFGRDPNPPQPKPAAALLAYAGTYTDGAAYSRATILVRGDSLYTQDGGRLVRRAGGHWTPAEDEGGVTRLWFDKKVGDRAAVLSFCGAPLNRIV
jgi:CubicO group peptidase (beta-lactamase class C family)